MSRPNVLLITTDQQRFDTIAAMGNQHVFTPHLNWLADGGLVFANAYSACPLCMPARATMMTGKEAHTHGMVGNRFDLYPMRDNVTFPTLLTKSGYQTKAVGKLHFHPMRTSYGIEHAELPADYFAEMRRLGKPHTRLHGVGENEMEPVINTLPEEDTLTHWIVRRSMEFLDVRDPTRPFFLWTSFPKPHPPLDPLLSYWQLYADMEMEDPVMGDWVPDVEDAPAGFYQPTFKLNNLWRMSPRQMQAVKRAYYACITQIDYNLGLLFARLRELELLENTWIIFTSDHGEMLGDHRMGAKSVFLEGSSHIPMIIKPPAPFGESSGEYAATRCGQYVTLADIMPTILDVCGVAAPGGLDGDSLLRIWREDVPRRVFGSCEDRCFMLLEDGFKYTWCAQGGDELFFCLRDDPMERTDLSHSEGHCRHKERMRRIMTEYMRESGSAHAGPDGLIAMPRQCSHRDVPRFPGLNTTLLARDSFH